MSPLTVGEFGSDWSFRALDAADNSARHKVMQECAWLVLDVQSSAVGCSSADLINLANRLDVVMMTDDELRSMSRVSAKVKGECEARPGRSTNAALGCGSSNRSLPNR